MTKKDYELIAEAINGTSYSDDGLDGLAYLLAAKFESDNPRFNRNKFLQACGIETEPVIGTPESVYKRNAERQ